MNLFQVDDPRLAVCSKARPNPDASLPTEFALRTLTMSIVHDLRSPLAAIHSGAEVLSGPQIPEQQVRRLARNMYSASVRIQQMLHEYAELCRTAELQRQPYSLRAIVAQAVDQIKAAAEAHSVVVAHNVHADVSVNVDRVRIGSVLVNLLMNAIEAMPAGGSIQICTAGSERSVAVRVIDTGPGVAAEIRDRLFQPFVTGKPNGWGLGLAQARQTVLEHGGDMWLESQPGMGACFGFSLPVQPGSRQP